MTSSLRRVAWAAPALLLVVACPSETPDAPSAEAAPADATPAAAPAEAPDAVVAPAADEVGVGPDDGKPRPGVYLHVVWLPVGPVGVGDASGETQLPVSKVMAAERGYRVEDLDARGRVVASHDLTLDERSLIDVIVHRDAFGTPVGREKWLCTSAERCVKRAWDATGRNAYAPCHALRVQRPPGSLAEVHTCLDLAGTPMRDAEGVESRHYEEFPEPRRRRLNQTVLFYDREGLPLLAAGGYAGIAYERDRRGCLKEERRLDARREPVDGPHGWHRVAQTVTPGCQVLTREYWNAAGERVDDRYGVHRYELRYLSGLLERETRLGPNQAARRHKGDGAHVRIHTRDPEGRVVAIASFGTSGKKIDARGKVHEIRTAYDESGRPESRSAFDRVGRAVVDVRGVHRHFYRYDGDGRLALIAHVGIDGAPSADTIDEVRMEKRAYDEEGRIASRSYWKDEETPMSRWSGIHEYRYTYDDRGYLVERTAWSAAGQAAREKSGDSRQVLRYDDAGQLVSRAYFHGDKAVNIGLSCVSGYHRVRFDYDDHHRLRALRYYGADQVPADADLCQVDADAHKVEPEYEGDQVVAQRLYLAGRTVPARTLDCRRGACLDAIGLDVVKLQ